MNCLDSRRRLLIAPRHRVEDHALHLLACRPCTRLLSELASLDRRIARTAQVTVPDGLAERILLVRSYPRRWSHAAPAAAAGLVVALGSLAFFPPVLERPEAVVAADSVGPTHPAVAAMSLVKHASAPPPATQPLDTTLAEERLRYVGLELRNKKLRLSYVGPCEVAGRDCERLVLATPEGPVNVFLIAHEHPSGAVLVEARRMAALFGPAPSGAYIVVATSAEAAKRAQKLLVHG